MLATIQPEMPMWIGEEDFNQIGEQAVEMLVTFNAGVVIQDIGLEHVLLLGSSVANAINLDITRGYVLRK